MTKVFISHSSADKEFAMKLYSWLRDFQYIDVIWIDTKELKPGVKFKAFLNDLSKSDIVIVSEQRISKVQICTRGD